MKLSNLIPLQIRKKILKAHQQIVFSKALSKYQSKISNDLELDDKLLKDLIYGWGNQGFSAKVNYLRSCIEHARKCKGDILECGSGLTTVLLSIIAKKRNVSMVSLENNRDYGLDISDRLKKIETADYAHIKIDDLKDYGDFEWYNTDKLKFKNLLGLVIIDGPPGSTKGGRYGLVPLLKDNFDNNTVFLVDDTSRTEEQQMIEKWKDIIDFEVNYPNKDKAHAVLKSN